MADPFLIFWETSTLFSIMAVPIYIFIKSGQESPFLQFLTNTYYLLSIWSQILVNVSQCPLLQLRWWSSILVTAYCCYEFSCPSVLRSHWLSKPLPSVPVVSFHYLAAKHCWEQHTTRQRASPNSRCPLQMGLGHGPEPSALQGHFMLSSWASNLLPHS